MQKESVKGSSSQEWSRIDAEDKAATDVVMISTNSSQLPANSTIVDEEELEEDQQKRTVVSQLDSTAICSVVDLLRKGKTKIPWSNIWDDIRMAALVAKYGKAEIKNHYNYKKKNE